MTAPMRPKGPLLVIAGATIMALAVFLPVVLGPETSFVVVHRQWFWFDDAGQYASALLVPFAIGSAAVWALARPGSRGARVGLVAAAAGSVIVALGTIAYDLTRSSMPQLQTAYLRGAIGLVLGASIATVGTVVALRSSTTRWVPAAGRSGAAGPLLALIGAFFLAIAQPLALAAGARDAGTPYAGDVAWSIWSHRGVHLALLVPAIVVTVVALWVLAAPASHRAALAFVVTTSALALGVVGAAIVVVGGADEASQRSFFLQVGVCGVAGAVVAASGGWITWRRWRGRRAHAHAVVAAAVPV